MEYKGVLRYLSGSVTVCADGPFTERLLNICMHRNMPVWAIRRCGNSRIVFTTDISSFKRMRTPAKRTRSHVRIIKRNGLPFLIHRYRHRSLSLCGGIILVGLLWYASTHIMGITVFGNTSIDTSVILDNLAKSGLSLGVKTSSVDNDTIRNRMMREIDELAWIGINANGSRVYIEIVERIEQTEGVENDGIACNLVAARDGEIERLEVREGQTVVKIGSGVRKGDVIVSGIVDSSVSGFRYVKARGSVYAKTSYKKTAGYPLKYVEEIPTGRSKSKYTLSILNADIPLYFSANSGYAEYSSEVTLSEYRIPIDIFPSVFVKKESFAELSKAEKTRTPAQAVELGISELSSQLRAELPPDIEVIEQKESHTLNERGEVEVTVELICREDIAEQSVIERAIPEPE